VIATIDNVFAATAHAPYHVTRAYGENLPQIFVIPNPDLSIYFATYMAL